MFTGVGDDWTATVVCRILALQRFDERSLVGVIIVTSLISRPVTIISAVVDLKFGK